MQSVRGVDSMAVIPRRIAHEALSPKVYHVDSNGSVGMGKPRGLELRRRDLGSSGLNRSEGSTMATSTTSLAGPQTVGGTSLHGRIDAIGIHDLLRIGVAQGSTGRLLVFNDRFDAELHYVEGRLIAVTSDGSKGTDCLNSVLQMTEGEFEFTTGAESASDLGDAKLHDAMTQAIRRHYQERVRAQQDSVGDQHQFVRTSGVHRMVTEQTVAVSPLADVDPKDQTPAAAKSPQLLRGEVGRAFSDNTGRTAGRLGTITSQQAALVALTSKYAQNLASILGMRELQRFEILATDQRALLCRVGKDAIRFSATTGEVDMECIWTELET